MLLYLLERSSKLNKKHLHKHLEAGMEMEDWNEIVNELKQLSERYQDSRSTMDTDDSDDDE